MVIDIDLIKLLRLNLNINEYLTLLKIYNILNDEEVIPFNSDDLSKQTLKEKKYIIENKDGSIELSKDGIALFEIDKDLFQELFDIYPYRTPNGRILRSKTRKFGGKDTLMYAKTSKKYNLLIRNKSEHELVIKNTKSLIDNYKRRNSLNYLPELTVYVNQKRWELIDTEEETKQVKQVLNANRERL